MPSQTAKLMLSFINRIRIAAAHDPACEPDQNPVQRAYEGCISKLSDEERGELVRIIDKLSQQLEKQGLREVPDGAKSEAPIGPADDARQHVRARGATFDAYCLQRRVRGP
jgi:hypothetical protein